MDVALVVRRAAGVDAAVLDHRLERRPLPQVERVDRLDVVVGIDDDRRRALGVQPVRVDDGCPPVGDTSTCSKPMARESIGDELGGRPHVGVVFGQRADARDAQQIEVVGQALVCRPLEERVQVVEAVGSIRPRSSFRAQTRWQPGGCHLA